MSLCVFSRGGGVGGEVTVLHRGRPGNNIERREVDGKKRDHFQSSLLLSELKATKHPDFNTFAQAKQRTSETSQ